MGTNSVPGADAVFEWLTAATQRVPDAMKPMQNFYQRYAASKNKPLMLSESGAPIVEGWTGDPELTIKQTWWRQILDPTLRTRLPLLKLVVNFDERKSDDGVLMKDWRIVTTPNAAIRNAFLADLPTYEVGQNLVYANQFNFTCDGAMQLLS